jgi:CubicO group peptidase (beta-lactamase class C family)
MKHTFVFEPKDTAIVAKSYYRNGREYSYNNCDGIYGDKNVYSTARDLLKWDQALYTEKILTNASKELAFAPYSNEKPGINNYGLGWRMKIFPNGNKFVFHNGWWHGNKNAFIRLIQDTAVLICLGNNYQDANYATMELSFLFGDYPFGVDPEAKKDTTGNAQKILIDQLKAKADSLKLLVIKKPVAASSKPQKKDSLPKKPKDTAVLTGKIGETKKNQKIDSI